MRLSTIQFNRELGEGFYLMQADHPNTATMGQFYMLRAWDTYPVLSRPISIYDADKDSVTFLYKVVGKGTALLAQLKAGEEVTLDGPHGNGWPQVTGKIAMVGGGVGIAPFYMAAKELRKLDPGSTIDLFLGFNGKALLTQEFERVVDRLVVNVGGFVTDDIDPTQYDAILTCGPEIMMRVLHKKCKAAGVSVPLYVSMENRMACGFGACLVCSCKTTGGNRKACKDGPVFLGNEVFDCE